MCAAQTKQQKLRHHITPVVYLSGFTDREGKIVAYRKDDPSKSLHLTPESIGFERHYYSQPLPNGGKDNNTLEDLFGTVEGSWRPIVQRIKNRLDVSGQIGALLVFVSLMRVRGPAARDLYETAWAENVKFELKRLDQMGHLPPKPDGHADILDHLKVSIDPHRSIHAMPDLIRTLGVILDQIGFEIVHNETESTIITSDNPVVYYDPTIDETRMQPYAVRRYGGSIELLFPIDSQTLLHGHSNLKDYFATNGMRHIRLTNLRDLKKINRLVARFGYRYIFASSNSHERLIQKYAHESPVLRVQVAEETGVRRVSYQQVFGPRPNKAKWNYGAQHSAAE